MMAEYLAPGVYVEEFESGLKPMEGVSTSTAGFVGVTRRGPVTGVPEFVGSFSEYQRKFGGYLPRAAYGAKRFLPMAIDQFFANGGSRCFVSRLLPEGSAAASIKLGELTLTASDPGVWGNSLAVRCCKDPMNDKLCKLQISCEGYDESYVDVTLDPAADGYLPRLLEKSLLARADYTPAAEVPDLAEMFPKPTDENEKWRAAVLEGGLDCPADAALETLIDAALLKGADNGPGKRTGLNALCDAPEVSIVVAPGAVTNAEAQEVITHCMNMGNRVCILDMPGGINKVGEIQEYRANFDSSFAALYHPWIEVFDPLEKKASYLPPSGSMAGIYARTDNTRGVHKAPANEVVRSCTGLETLFGKPEQDMLNPIGVNLIRNIPGQGIRVWGARTATSDSSWKYVNVRRLFIFIEESIRRNTGWAVFEPNDQMLWTKVQASISSFLGGLWRDGALAGASEGEAFFVNIGKGSTMTQDDILNGRLICVIGVAPVRPAEFVIFRITQIMESNS